MNHLKWMGHSATIFDIHKNLRSDLQTCEVTLIAKGHSVKAHRFVLSSCSDLLRTLLSDIPLGQDCSIMVPDIKGHLLDNVLAFIYLGECSLSSSNLSEFLETINVLGIKSAISFECNTNALQAAQQQQQQQQQQHHQQTSTANISSAVSSASSATVIDGGTLSSVRHISTSSANEADTPVTDTLQREDLIETQAVLTADTPHTVTNSSSVVTSDASSRELEFLDVYHEPQHKITYSIEHVPGAAGGNEFILTENSGTFTLTHNHKLESNSSSESANMEVTEDEACESHIIEEYSSGDEQRLIHITESTGEPALSNVSVPVANNTTSTASIIQLKSKTIKTLKIKNHSTPTTSIIPKIEPINTSLNSSTQSDDPMTSILHSTTSGESFKFIKNTSANDSLSNNTNESGDFSLNSPGLSAADMAYQAMANEGMSLPKAAVKFNVSKSELWSRVRKTGVDTLHKSPKLDPEKLDVIEMASQAVINEGLSLQKAAERFDISKTVLWRRVRKHPQYMKTARENPIISKAYERLKSGESLKSISQDLDIPMSTLHRHKVRLSQNGQLPDFVTCKKRDSTSKDDLKVKLAKAVHACVHEGMSQNHAANLYEISKSTLWRHLQRRVAEAEAEESAEGGADESMSTEDIIKEEVILP